MAKFRYRMQNILDIKEKIESQEKIAYSQANAALSEEQDKLTNLMIRSAGYEHDLKEATSGELDFKEIRKTHENLKEKAFDEFKQELNAEENKITDELVSYTYKPDEDGEN